MMESNRIRCQSLLRATRNGQVVLVAKDGNKCRKFTPQAWLRVAFEYPQASSRVLSMVFRVSRSSVKFVAKMTSSMLLSRQHSLLTHIARPHEQPRAAHDMRRPNYFRRDCALPSSSAHPALATAAHSQVQHPCLCLGHVVGVSFRGVRHRCVAPAGCAAWHQCGNFGGRIVAGELQ